MVKEELFIREIKGRTPSETEYRLYSVKTDDKKELEVGYFSDDTGEFILSGFSKKEFTKNNGFTKLC